MQILYLYSCEYTSVPLEAGKDISFALTSSSSAVYIETLNKEKFPIVKSEWHEPADMKPARRLKPFRLKLISVMYRTAPIISLSEVSYLDRVSSNFYDKTILFPETLRQLKSISGSLFIRSGQAIVSETEAIYNFSNVLTDTSISHIDEVSKIGTETKVIDGEFRLTIQSEVSRKTSQGFIIHEK